MRDTIQQDIRRIAIDILQCGNYVEWSKLDQARKNINSTIKTLGTILEKLDK